MKKKSKSTPPAKPSIKARIRAILSHRVARVVIRLAMIAATFALIANTHSKGVAAAKTEGFVAGCLDAGVGVGAMLGADIPATQLLPICERQAEKYLNEK